MARSTTAAEAAALTSRNTEYRLRVEVQDSGGTWRDWSALDGVDYTLGGDVGASLRDGFITGNLTFFWKRYRDNLSPFGPSGGRYTDYIDLWRRIRINVKTLPSGADASLYAWNEICDGRVTSYSLDKNPGTLSFISRLSGEAQRTSFIDAIRSYGDSAGTIDIEDAAQDLANDWFDPTQTTPTIDVPTATSRQVKSWDQQKQTLWEALRVLANQIGWLIEERWTGSAFELQLYGPDRSQTTADFVIGSDLIKQYGRWGLDDDNIRNIVEVVYQSSAGIDLYRRDDRLNVVRTASTSPAHTKLSDGATAVAASSIDIYGPRYAGFVEGATSLVQTSAQAVALADDALSDLSDPTLLTGVTVPLCFWAAELNDLLEFTADGERSQTSVKLAVQSYRFSFSPTDGASTTWELKGKPGMPKEQWLAIEGRSGVEFPSYVESPPAPDVDVFRVAGRGTFVLLRETPGHDWNYDQIIWHRSTDPDFEPSPSTFWRAGRETFLTPFEAGGITYYYKALLRDAQGNITTPSGAAPTYQDLVMLQPQLTPLTVNVSQIAAPALNGSIDLFGQAISGTQFLSGDDQWCAPEPGMYQVAASLYADAAPSSGTLQIELFNVDSGEVVLTGPVNGSSGSSSPAVYPQLEEITQYEGNNVTTHPVSLPPTNDGDLLVMTFSQNGSDLVTSGPSGWTLIANDEEPGGVTYYGWIKRADGAEGTTVDVTVSSARDCSAQVHRYRAGTWHDNGTLGDAFDTGTPFVDTGDASPDPPSVTISWGADFTEVITCGAVDAGVNLNNVPIGYSDGTETRSADTTDVTTISARRRVNGSSETPSNFTINASEESVTNTIAIRGSQGGGGGNGQLFQLNGVFPADEGDCFELRLGGSGTVGTFDFDGTVAIVPVDGTIGVSSRTNPDPHRVQAIVGWVPGLRPIGFGGGTTGEILDAEPRTGLMLTGSQPQKARAGEGEIQRWRTAEDALAGITVVFGDEADRAADADDSAFSAVTWDRVTGEMFAAGHTRDDAGTDYAFVIQFAADATSPAEVDEVTLSTLGTDEEVPTGVRVRSSDQMVWVATKRDTGDGRIFRVQMGGGGSIDETGADLADLLDLVLLEFANVVDLAIAVAAGNLYCYDADDLTDQQWTVDITTTYGETFREPNGNLRESADGAAFYMAPGGGHDAADGANTLYKFDRAGNLLWSRDVSSRTNLATIDGVGPIDVHPTSGDVFAVAIDYNSGRPLWDVLHFSRTGDFLGSMRKTFGFDPQHAVENQRTGVDAWPPIAIHRHGKSLTVYFRDGESFVYQVQTTSEFQDPGTAIDTTFHELVFDGLSDGDVPEFVTLRETSDSPGEDLLLQQSTAANRATYRVAGGSLKRPCLELDGVNDYYELVGDLAEFAMNEDATSAVAIFALVEPTNAGGFAYPVVTLWSQSIGEDAPLMEVGVTEVTGAAKYGPGGAWLGTAGRSGGFDYASYFESARTEITDKAVLVGIQGPQEFVDDQVLGQWEGNGAFRQSQLVQYKEALCDSFASYDTSKTADDATHWYRCDATSPADVGDGTTQNASAIGTPTLTTSPLVELSYAALDLDAGDGLSIASNADMDLGTDETMTWEFWVQPDATWAGDILIAQKLDASDGWILYWDHSALRFVLDITWNAGGSTISVQGPLQSAAPPTANPTHVAFTTGASHAQVWQDGIPGTENVAGFGDATNASAIRIAATDGNTPGGISDFDGKLDEFGMFTTTQHPFSIWYRHRVGRNGHDPAVRMQGDPAVLRDEKITIGRNSYGPTYFQGFIYKIWMTSLEGAVYALAQQQHNLMRQFLPSITDAGTPARTASNDPRWYSCAHAWLWCRFWEASGATFASETEDVGPHFTQRDGTAANVSAYQQAPPNILGLGSGAGGGVFEDFASGYAITAADNTTVTFDLPTVGIHLETAWSVSWAHKWDTGSVHTRGHIWSIDLSSGYIRVSIAANQIRVEWNDGTATVTSDFTPETNPLDGNWHACEVRFSSGLGGALMDIDVRHSGGTWYPALPTDVDALDPADYGDMAAAEIVFGAGSNVPANEEFEGDLAQLRVAFGDLSTRAAW